MTGGWGRRGPNAPRVSVGWVRSVVVGGCDGDGGRAMRAVGCGVVGWVVAVVARWPRHGGLVVGGWVGDTYRGSAG